MYNELVCYKCYCAKCPHQWITKGKVLPLACPKCQTRKWNDDDPKLSEPVPAIEQAPVITSSDPLATFIAKAQAKKGIAPAPIVETAPLERDWTGWSDEMVEYANGDKITFRLHHKTRRKEVISQESNLDNFA